MSAAKHTPCPWQVAKGNRRVRTAGDYLTSDAICTVESSDADACLIAAAPELLAALQSVFRRRNEGTDAALWAEWDTVADILAKATKEQA